MEDIKRANKLIDHIHIKDSSNSFIESVPLGTGIAGLEQKLLLKKILGFRDGLLTKITTKSHRFYQQKQVLLPI